MRDVGKDVKKGDLGGYVESESNLSYEPHDDAWLYDDAIACNTAYVCQGSVLRENAVAKDVYKRQVYYSGLKAGTEYTLKGVLMDKATE